MLALADIAISSYILIYLVNFLSLVLRKVRPLQSSGAKILSVAVVDKLVQRQMGNTKNKIFVAG